MEGVDGQALGSGQAGPIGRGKKRGGQKKPLWRCAGCGWHLYLPTEGACPLCAAEQAGDPSALEALPLPADERRPPWRPSVLPSSSDSSSSSSAEVTTSEVKRSARGPADARQGKRAGDGHDDAESDDQSASSDDEGEGDGGPDHHQDEEDDDEDELEALGGGWRPEKAVAGNKGQREVKVYNVGTVGQRKKSAIPPKPSGATRFVCISDTHSKHRQLELPAGDVLIHSGDFSLSCKETELVDFTEWIHDQPFKHKIVVAGNHDVMMHTEFYERHHWRFHQEKVERHLELKQRLRDVCTYLEHELCDMNGIKIFGSPWVPYYHDWAFMLPDAEMFKAVWDTIPSGIDVLITHGPPHKIRDNTFHGARAGCPQLADAVKRLKPAVHCFGHIHDGYGVAKQGRSTFINAAIVNTLYKVANSPIVFDIQ